MSNDTSDPTHGVPDDDLTALEAVSAFVDGVATPEERALVEASPELRALAARWSEQRDTLAAADRGPSDEVREAGLAAAMSLYDELYGELHGELYGVSTPETTVTEPAPVPAAATAGANVLRFERRRRQQRWLMGAAAAVVVLFVGGIVATGGPGGSDDTSTVADAPSAVSGDVEILADATAKADPAATPMADDALTAEAAEAAEDSSAAGGMGETGPAGSETTAAASADTLAPEATTFGGGVDALPGPAEVVETLAGEAELLAFASARSAQLPLPGLAFPCVEDGLEALGTAIYRGVDVVVVRDPDSGEVRAVDFATCDVVASARP